MAIFKDFPYISLAGRFHDFELTRNRGEKTQQKTKQEMDLHIKL
jgi:hypothetical protein